MKNNPITKENNAKNVFFALIWDYQAKKTNHLVVSIVEKVFIRFTEMHFTKVLSSKVYLLCFESELVKMLKYPVFEIWTSSWGPRFFISSGTGFAEILRWNFQDGVFSSSKHPQNSISKLRLSEGPSLKTAQFTFGLIMEEL